MTIFAMTSRHFVEVIIVDAATSAEDEERRANGGSFKLEFQMKA